MTHTNYTLCIYSSNSPGMLHRITVLFTRRKLNIESLTVSETGTHGVSRFTIVAQTDRDTIEKVARQVRRIVDVYEVFVCRDEELISREVALFKVPSGDETRALLGKLGLRILEEQDDCFIIEQTGSEEEINTSLRELRPIGVHELVRSGRIGIRRIGASLREVMEAYEQPQEPAPESWI